MRQERNNTARRTTGFTMIEMLVVISIIALLATILVPAIGRAMLLAKIAASQARIYTLAAACQNYFEDTGRRFFPGQAYPEMLTGSPDTPPTSFLPGKITGSEMLALALFNPKNGTSTHRNVFTGPPADPGLRSIVTGYIPYSDDWFADNWVQVQNSPDQNGQAHFMPPLPTPTLILVDGVGDMPILYYPSRIGQTGITNNVFNAFVYNDNKKLTTPILTPIDLPPYQPLTDPTGLGSPALGPALFNNYIGDTTFSNPPQNPHNETTFLLMVAGDSRTYFNLTPGNGDPRNF